MSSDRLPFVTFEPRNGGFRASLSIEGLLSNENDPELVLKDAVSVYARSITKMRALMAEIRACRAARRRVPARKIWRLGNAIFELTDELSERCLQLNNVYAHLARDLGVKRKWLEKVVIFRRYLPAEEVIPESLNWGRCEKGTRRKAERIAKGLPLA